MKYVDKTGKYNACAVASKMRITQEKTDAIAVLMDDETREKVHRELAPCEPIEFLKRYCELEPSFEAVLKDEFSIEI